MKFKLYALIIGIIAYTPALLPVEADELIPGEAIHLQGQVLDTTGAALADALVEIWQVDASGNYNHPDESDADELMDDFQYFGSTLTDEAGNFAFQTVVPPAYDRRPPHIHYRIKQGGETLFTSQFYVSTTQRDGDETQLMDIRSVEPDSDAGDHAPQYALVNVIIDMNGAAADDLAPTSADVEGPYYPMVTIADYDNNLNSTAADDEPIEPILPAEFTLVNLNTAMDEEFNAVPNMNRRMLREFKEYRPYISIRQFRLEINKYISMEQVSAYEAYVFVPVRVNAADAATLQQIPGLDEVVAEALASERPFDSLDAFLAALSEHLLPWEVDYAANFLANES